MVKNGKKALSAFLIGLCITTHIKSMEQEIPIPAEIIHEIITFFAQDCVVKDVLNLKTLNKAWKTFIENNKIVRTKCVEKILELPVTPERIAALKKYITADKSLVNHVASNGLTPLLWATGSTDINLVNLLLGKGADIMSNAKGKNILHHIIDNQIDGKVLQNGKDQIEFAEQFISKIKEQETNFVELLQQKWESPKHLSAQTPEKLLCSKAPLGSFTSLRLKFKLFIKKNKQSSRKRLWEETTEDK